MKKILLMVLLLVVASGCSESPEERRDRLFSEAKQDINEFKFDAATDKLARLKEENPDSPLAFLGEGLIYERKMLWYDALHNYVTLTNSNPSLAEAQAGVWRILTATRMFPEATNAANRYREAAPYDPGAIIAQCESFINEGIPNRGIAVIDSAIEYGANPARLDMIKARAFMEDDNPNAADSVYRAAIAEANSDPAVLAEAVPYLLAAGLIDSAMIMSRKAVELARSESDQLLRHFEAALEARYLHESRMVVAEFEALGAPQVILEILKARHYLAANKTTPSRKAIDMVTSLTEGSISSRVWEIIVKREASDERTPGENIRYLVTVFERQGFDPEYQSIMAFILAREATELLQGRLALDALGIVPERYRNRREFAVRKAAGHFHFGQEKEFEQERQFIRKYHDHEADWMARLADIYAFTRPFDYDKAAEIYAEALGLDPWYRPAFESWVRMYRELRQFDKAAALFDTYSHFPERYPRLAMLEGICLAEAGKVDKGTDVFLMNAAAVRGDMFPFDELRRILERKWQVDPLTRLAEWLAVEDSDIPDARVLASVIFSELGDYQTARIEADEAQNLAPQWPDAAAAMARALYGLGETAAAINMLEDVLNENRYHITSNYWLSHILATEGMEGQKAQNLARQALFDSNQRPQEWLNLSYVYFQTGRFDLAESEAIKISRSFEHLPEGWFRLGMARYMQSDYEEAQKNLEHAIEIGLAGDELREAESVLRKMKS